eukprot:1664009-Rhodomonas_salina.5
MVLRRRFVPKDEASEWVVDLVSTKIPYGGMVDGTEIACGLYCASASEWVVDLVSTTTLYGGMVDGTESAMAYAGTHCCARYAISSTDLVYAAMLCAVLRL